MSQREIIVNGLRYYLGPYHRKSEWTPSHYKGFGGRHWTIRFHDGELIKTDDLMHDYTFKTDLAKDTAIILEGWNVTATDPVCGWQQAGEFQVFGPIREKAVRR